MWIFDIVIDGLKALFKGLLSGWFKKSPEQKELEEAKDAKDIQESVESESAGSAGDWLHKKHLDNI